MDESSITYKIYLTVKGKCFFVLWIFLFFFSIFPKKKKIVHEFDSMEFQGMKGWHKTNYDIKSLV